METESKIHKANRLPDGRGGRRREIGEGDKGVQIFIYKINDHRYKMYSEGNRVNNYVISLYSDR